MKKYFLAGLVTLVPIVITLLIGLYLLDLFTEPFVHAAKDLLLQVNIFPKETALIYFVIRLIVLSLLIVAVLLTGYLGQRFFIYKFFQLTDRLFRSIPFVKSIYRITMDVTKSFLTDSNKTFEKSIIVPFPTENTYVLAFETGPVPECVKNASKEPLHKTVFVPTAPHPISGFLLMCADSEIQEINVPVDEAFKFLFSCGSIVPTGKAVLKPNAKSKKKPRKPK